MHGMTSFARILAVIVVSAAFVTAAPASAKAQESTAAENWITTRVREHDAVIAAAPFSNGITLMARCMDNVFGLVLTGLPEVAAPATSRSLILVVGDDEERPYIWNIAAAERSAALSRVPAIIARQLAKGGRLQIIVPAEEGERRTRYVVDLPRSGAGIEEVLTRCGRPLVDPRDDLLQGDGAGMARGYVWRQMPRPEFPSPTVHGARSGGMATMSCQVLETGRVTDCEIEDEFPAGFGFGQAARRGVSNARIGQTEEAREAGRPFAGGRIIFTTTFMMSR